MEDGFRFLAEAVVLQAVEDYRLANRVLSRFPDFGKARALARDAERFFRSRWFTCLTSLDGEQILEMLKGGLQER